MNARATLMDLLYKKALSDLVRNKGVVVVNAENVSSVAAFDDLVQEELAWRSTFRCEVGVTWYKYTLTELGGDEARRLKIGCR